jgi:Fe-S-cluster containining protein
MSQRTGIRDRGSVGGSLCDRCYAPGQCCKGFTLFTPEGEERTFWVEGDDTVEDYLGEHELPFTPELLEEFADPETGRKYGSYRFSCAKLDGDGRCSIYDDRPEICRNFEPAGGSLLCVHSFGAEGTGDGL